MRDKKILWIREGGKFLRVVFVECFIVFLCDMFVC